jgi:hypothetical protein
VGADRYQHLAKMDREPDLRAWLFPIRLLVLYGQLPHRQRCLYRSLRQLFQRVRNPKGDEEQRRGVL